MTKDELKDKLTELEIPFDADADVKTLKKLLKEHEDAEGGDEDETEDEDVDTDAEGIVVGDPQVLRPVELPLVITPAKGKDWKNPEQAEYAAYLNAYAYRNTAKWDTKKKVLLKRLVEIGNDPSKLNLYRGGESRVTFKNKLTQTD